MGRPRGRPRTREIYYNHQEGISGDFDEALQQFAEQIKDAARAGAQAMAQVVYESARQNVPVSSAAHMFHGENQIYGPYKPGSLRDSIYQVHSKDNSANGTHTYHVAWNHNKVPYGFMVEFGTVRAPAHPFLYPAFSENKPRLVAVATAAMAEKLGLSK